LSDYGWRLSNDFLSDYLSDYQIHTIPLVTPSVIRVGFLRRKEPKNRREIIEKRSKYEKFGFFDQTSEFLQV